MTARIHTTALVSPKAQLANDVEVGPYSQIGADVVLDSGCQIASHVVIEGHTRLGKNNQVGSFTVLGGAPQDKSYKNEPTRLEIGDNNVIREFCTINRGTLKDEGVTRIGSHNWIMSYIHAAHDCQIGDQTVIANNTQLAGHVHIGDWVVLGGNVLVHQFVHIGAHALCGINSVLTMDVPPYILVSGNPAYAASINAIGLKRRGFNEEQVRAIRRAFKTVWRQNLPLTEAIAHIHAQANSGTHAVLEPLIQFLQTRGSKAAGQGRSILRGRRHAGAISGE